MADSTLTALLVAPDMPDAECAGQWTLFDPPEPGEPTDSVKVRQLAALTLCRRCTEIQRCTEWVDSLPPRHQPLGVVAARITEERPKRATKPRQPANPPTDCRKRRTTEAAQPQGDNASV
jgi:hypothetical protein